MRSAFRQERKKERKNGPGACALAQMGEYANRKPLSKWRITPPAKQMAVLRIFSLKKMNRLALQNPPRQAEKRQCPVFLPEEQWPDEMHNVLFIRRYAKRLFLRFHENGGTMRLSLRSPYCH
jgi:hypothetical protein